MIPFVLRRFPSNWFPFQRHGEVIQPLVDALASHYIPPDSTRKHILATAVLALGNLDGTAEVLVTPLAGLVCIIGLSESRA